MDFTTQNCTDLFAALAARMAAERDALCALDGLIGDADHGIAMAQGMSAAALAVENLATLQDQFNAAAKAFLNAVGASSGPLYATALMRAAKAAGPRAAMPRAETPSLITAMAEGIAHRGKAAPGQKTMIDAWHPASEAAKSGASWPEILQAAQTGADATAQMQASLGRAATLGARSLGHKDPGAVSASMIIAEFARALG
ncbi:dihydroxyacetone kinase subunit L [Cypionkella aquatica]|uniref:Dihydroxyacetone kinase subunit L n=1 Tax=Cypionkella aquatica TaxID=1756042 RepID=A0AA37X5R1_9RHOB|nr:dihydroxyacetone kinase subunit DhaL [Cypionkella aquatica]GLS88191.1 dihydroxyacetone kinase subunit L [Cypionkella aquatica]